MKEVPDSIGRKFTKINESFLTALSIFVELSTSKRKKYP